MTTQETPFRIEPTRLEHPKEEITDLVAQISRSAAVLSNCLHPNSAANLRQFVQIMNSYYSNLIEGHKTLPRDIERALKGEVSTSQDRRNLQLEAAAHVRVQEKVDNLFAKNQPVHPLQDDFILWLHGEFYQDVPDEFLEIKGPKGMFRMQPGRFRAGNDQDVEVGRHIPPSSNAVTKFMDYFTRRFAEELSGGITSQIIAYAISHHRFNYIHPFPDGNGRVSRLMTHAIAQKIGIGAHGLWSISRGLARGLKDRSEYKAMMDLADTPRRGDTDGRGNLSRDALSEFVTWFLKVTLDQIQFMSELLDLNTLSGRLKRLVEQTESLRFEATPLLQQALIRGQIERGDAPAITGLPERSARRVLDALENEGLLASVTPKGPVSLRFPVDTRDILFPKLFQD